MADAEHGRLCEPFAQQPIEVRLRCLIHRRGRLVEEEPVGLLDEDPCEGNALLLARGELERPARGLVEAPGELREPHGLERLAQCCIADAPHGHRKAHHVPERADRQVRPLRQKEDPGVQRRADLTAPERPDAGDGTDERALA
jgi:hypothetical protein